jgi:UDP-N-acetylglucosamine 2-epimerase
VVEQQEPAEVTSLLSQLGLARRENEQKRLILVTAHRRENFGQPIENICLAIKEIARLDHGKIEIVYPVHPNPNIQSLYTDY